MRILANNRYGTRLVLDMARHHDEGPLSLTDISRRRGISLKYPEQIEMNLAVNAQDAMPKGGHLTVKLGEVEVDDTSCATRHGASLRPPRCTKFTLRML